MQSIISAGEGKRKECSSYVEVANDCIIKGTSFPHIDFFWVMMIISPDVRTGGLGLDLTAGQVLI